MKKLILIISILAITGCSVFTSRYDNIEYSSYIKLLTMAEEATPYCDDFTVVNQYLTLMQTESTFLANYAKYRVDNVESSNIATIIGDNISEMSTRYTQNEAVSEAYCKAKLTILQTGLKAAAKAMAKRPVF